MEDVDWLLLAYGELPSRISLKSRPILLSTLSRRLPAMEASPSPRVAPEMLAVSSEVGRSNLRSMLLVGLGETMEATLMLLAAGETKA
jgi:hypothetical protein